MTGPMLFRVTFGSRLRKVKRTGVRVLATNAEKIRPSDCRRRSERPCFCRLTTGRRLRRASCAFCCFRSNLRATAATYASAFGRFSFTRSLRAVLGGAASAWVTAPSTYAVVPSRRGLGNSLWRSTSSGSGRSKAAVTADTASSCVRPPTATPPIVTPSAITASAVVVVAPVVVRRRRRPRPGRGRTAPQDPLVSRAGF